MRVFFSGLLISLSVLVGIFMNHSEPSPCIWISKLKYFDKEVPILNAQDLEFVSEYYLLENLVSGLVHEEWLHFEVWENALCTKSYLERGTYYCHWDPDNRWSDGTLIQPQEILDHFNFLQQQSHQHLSLVKKAKISWDHDQSVLKFAFSERIQEKDFVHELALADAGLLHPKNRSFDWSVTSGPYYVASFSKEHIFLKANPYFRRKLDIQEVMIRPRRAPYLDEPFDLLKRPPYSLRAEVREMEAKAERVWPGMPTAIYYFRFGKNHPLSKSLKVRQKFFEVVKRTFQNSPDASHYVIHRQMLPKGYKGYLLEAPIIGVDETLEIKDPLPVSFEEHTYPDWIQNLKENGEALGLPLTVEVKPSQDEGDFAIQEIILGDQRDPRAIWNFLFNPGGPLNGFHDEVQDLLLRLDTDSMDLLHEKVLNEVMVIPFIAEYDAFLTSSRIDLSNINPFDQRPRFYRMTWNTPSNLLKRAADKLFN